MTTGSEDTRAEWLRGLGVGDEVIVTCSTPTFGHVHAVESATARVVTVAGTRYSRASGAPVNADRYERRHIEPLTDEDRETIRRIAALGSLCRLASCEATRAIPTERIEAAVALLTEGTPSDAP